MQSLNKAKLTFSMALPIIAFAAYIGWAPQSAAAACASDQCTYADQCYGDGACVKASCASPNCGQQCRSGSWGNCTVGCC